MRQRVAAITLALAALTAACGGGGEADDVTSGTSSTTITASTTGDGSTAPPAGGGSTAPPAGGGEGTATTAKGGTATTPRPTASPTTTAMTTAKDSTVTTSRPAPTTPGTSAPSVFVPPAGRYTYDTKGYSQSSGGVSSGERREITGTSTDDVTLSPQGGSTEVRTVTTFEGGRGQDTYVVVDGSKAVLRRLVLRSMTAGVNTEQNVNPSPPIPVAKLPYRVGDKWEASWRDDALGLQGVGAGETVREELIDTPAGRFDSVVIHMVQRVRGTFNGELETTIWIARSSGIPAKVVTVTDLQNTSGSNHTETTRTLTKAP